MSRFSGNTRYALQQPNHLYSTYSALITVFTTVVQHVAIQTVCGQQSLLDFRQSLFSLESAAFRNAVKNDICKLIFVLHTQRQTDRQPVLGQITHC